MLATLTINRQWMPKLSLRGRTFVARLEAQEGIDMRQLLLGFIMVMACAPLAYAVEQPNYWSRIKEIEKKSVSAKNAEAELLKFLTSLTQDQTLTLLRQFGKEAEAERRVESWPLTQFTVMTLMGCYPKVPVLEEEDIDNLPDRTKRNLIERVVPGPLSDEEYAKLSDRLRRDIKDGIVPGRLSKEAFDKLTHGIANRNEGTFFRYALAGWLDWSQKTSIQLSRTQKEQTVDTYFAVVSDTESPAIVRSECCEGARTILENEFCEIINSDGAVQEVLRIPARRRPNVNDLLKLGDRLGRRQCGTDFWQSVVGRARICRRSQ